MLQSCSTDECENVTCMNGGTCADGSCTCAAGYSGTDCSTADLCEINNVNCLNGGTCATSTGTCACTAGYEGDSCETKWNAKAVKIWNATDSCQSGSFTYATTVAAASGSATDITFSDFGGFTNATITGVFTSSTAFSIASQTDATGRSFVGSGTINSAGSLITLTYTVTFTDSTTDSCNASLI